MKNKYIKFHQPAGLGDILFLEPISRDFYEKGFSIYWPVFECYYEDLKRHIPYVHWAVYNPDDNFEYKTLYDFANATGYKIMESKYKIVDMDMEMWRTFEYKRDIDREKKLINHLGLDINKPYSLRHITYGTNDSLSGLCTNNHIPKNENMKTVDIDFIDGYSILDWSSIIENAFEIRFVSTSTLYLVEKLELINKPKLHLYARSQHKDPELSEVAYLCNKKWKLHTGIN